MTIARDIVLDGGKPAPDTTAITAESQAAAAAVNNESTGQAESNESQLDATVSTASNSIRSESPATLQTHLMRFAKTPTTLACHHSSSNNNKNPQQHHTTTCRMVQAAVLCRFADPSGLQQEQRGTIVVRDWDDDAAHFDPTGGGSRVVFRPEAMSPGAFAYELPAERLTRVELGGTGAAFAKHALLPMSTMRLHFAVYQASDASSGRPSVAAGRRDCVVDLGFESPSDMVDVAVSLDAAVAAATSMSLLVSSERSIIRCSGMP